MLFTIYGKAKKASGKNSIVAFIEAGNDRRALRDYENLVEDNNLNSEHYFKPVITNTPIVDDLPADGSLSETWCDRYQLDENKCWQVIAGAKDTDAPADTDIPAATLTPDEQVIAAYHFNSVYLTQEQMLVIDDAMKADPAGNPASEMAFALTNYSTQEAIDAELVRGEYPDAATGAYAIRCSLVDDLKQIWPGDKINVVGWRVMRKYALESLRADVAERKSILEKWVDGQPDNDGLPDQNAGGEQTTHVRDLPGSMQIAAHWLFGVQEITAAQLQQIEGEIYGEEMTPLRAVVWALDTAGNSEKITAIGNENEPSTPAWVVRSSLVSSIKVIWADEKKSALTQAIVECFFSAYYATASGARANMVLRWAENPPLTDEAARGLAGTKAGTQPKLKTVASLPFRRRILAQFLSADVVTVADVDLLKQIGVAELDTDNGYLQNLLLAADNCAEFKEKASDANISFLCEAIKSVWPVDGKKPDLNILMVFIRDWWLTPHINRGLFVKSWRTGKPCGPMPMKTTDTGTSAGGVVKTDRSDSIEHNLDTLDQEIAAALLPMDFNIYAIPAGILRRAKEMVQAKERPFAAWSKLLRQSAGVLDYSRAAIFALIRTAPEGIESDPVKHLEFINRALVETNHENPAPETLAAARHMPAASVMQDQIPTPAPQPEFKNVGGGMFSVEGLLSAQAANAEKARFIPGAHNVSASNEGEKPETVCTGCGAIGGGHCPDCGAVCGDATYAAMEEGLKQEPESAEETATANQEMPEPTQTVPEPQQNAPEVQQSEPKFGRVEPAPALPAYFEPGRYEDIPNEIYHSANGISSSMIKDARVSLMYYRNRHITKIIPHEETDALFFGTLVHALTLEPEKFDDEYVVFPGVPAGSVSTSSEMKEIIERYNASMPPMLSTDEIKRQIEAYNAQLPAPLSMSANADDTASLYAGLPVEFRTIPDGDKQTAGAMRDCLKKFNATLPVPLKTSGSRDALLDQLATIDPEFVAAERAKPQPFNTSGSKDELKKIVREINPRVIYADEFTAQWREANATRQIVSPGEYSLLREMHAAVYAHPNAGKLLRQPGRATEVSYFGVDDETGLDVRIRPDLEVAIGGVRIAMDLKTISTGKIKEAQLRQKLHREIIERDYHVSAAMYAEVGGFDQFFWIFVNKDKGHHWCALVEASRELLALGSLEYHQTKRRISNALDSGNWSAPITDFTDELTDFDARRFEALRQA